MRQAAGIVLLVCCVCPCVRAETRTLALYLKHSGGLTAESSEVMRSELRRLLGPARIDVVWKNSTQRRAGEAFDFVVVGSIEGSCSAAADLTEVPEPHGAVRLADTSVSENHVLPFFVVDCPHVIWALGNETVPSAVGRALARVIGHELYHILTKTTEHRHAGIAKAVFSIQDLVSPGLDFDSRSLSQMRSIS